MESEEKGTDGKREMRYQVFWSLHAQTVPWHLKYGSVSFTTEKLVLNHSGKKDDKENKNILPDLTQGKKKHPPQKPNKHVETLL